MFLFCVHDSYFKKCVCHNYTITETKYHITPGPNIMPLKYLLDVIVQQPL